MEIIEPLDLSGSPRNSTKRVQDNAIRFCSYCDADLISLIFLCIYKGGNLAWFPYHTVQILTWFTCVVTSFTCPNSHLIHVHLSVDHSLHHMPMQTCAQREYFITILSIHPRGENNLLHLRYHAEHWPYQKKCPTTHLSSRCVGTHVMMMIRCKLY